MEYFFGHITWIEERFQEAKYEDVTGLCKLASLTGVREQEYHRWFFRNPAAQTGSRQAPSAARFPRYLERMKTWKEIPWAR